VKQRQLEEDEQGASGDEIPRQNTGVGHPAADQKRRGAREEHERRRAEMRHPSREEHPGRRPAGRHTGIDPHVVDGHQYHYGTAQDVDRLNAGTARKLGGR
jgi:hypothetical protein